LAPRWEQRAPGRFAWELRALEAVVGETLVADETALAQGVLVVQFDWTVKDRRVALRAIYPDTYPRSRPIVLLCDPATFPRRHCGPVDGTLCLLGRDSRQWLQEWTLVELLEAQLDDALNDAGAEDEQGEPAEYWWNGFGLGNSYSLVDSQWSLGDATSGMMTVRCGFQPRPGSHEIHAVVTQVRDAAGTAICSWQSALPNAVASSQLPEVTVPWVYVDDILLPGQRVASQLAELKTRLTTKPRAFELSSATSAQLFAIAYRSELGFESQGLAWLFPIFLGSKKAIQSDHGKLALLPTYRAGVTDLGSRVPSVQVLRDKTIAVIGIGALGAPVAADLARAGCRKLHLVDHDNVEPGNSIRWPLGASAWGVKKVAAMAQHITLEYPWTDVVPHSHAIGSFDGANFAKGDAALFDAILQNADLVVDATASYGVSTALSDQCVQKGVPLISLYASPPVQGGVVARFTPQSGCPTCLEIAYYDGAIARAPGFGDDSGLQQPPGCAERTFTGSSFDLQELSLQAMRLITGTLQAPEGAASSVVYTLSFSDAAHQIAPSWRVDELPKAARCSCNLDT
jgi:ThiF family